jgi:hypothetical protein
MAKLEYLPPTLRMFGGSEYELINGIYDGYTYGCPTKQSAQRVADNWKQTGGSNTRIVHKGDKYWVYGR